MGTWRITVEGHGIHHNNRVDDADAMAKTFVKTLKAAGHQIFRADLKLTPIASSPEPVTNLHESAV